MFNGKLSVVMPAYNESASIVKNVAEAVQTLSGFGYDYEVVVVDDGSVDDTHSHAMQIAAKYGPKVRVVRYDDNRGKGGALICGTTYTTGDYIAFLDADMELHPEQLPLFLEILLAQNADVVIGSKRHPLSNVQYPRIRRIYSAGYFALVWLLFGLPLRDTQTGLKLFRRQVLQDVFPKVLVKRFAFDIEVLANAHRLGYKIVDAPVTLRFARRYGRITFHDIKTILLDTLAIFYRLRLLHYYDRVPFCSLTALRERVAAHELTPERQTPAEKQHATAAP
ncbi:MAG: glycosyltransferase [Candidatus Eremiobacteraeota bacterium]|nr:glycosyltransferase [Candidatus Eremiobacteraeota bacterium]